ncbi:MAG TPA: hypothetical protein PK208_10425 [Fibrobacteria bacterium]|nr:hypothetical protein [Fibrobacteria bacterium]
MDHLDMTLWAIGIKVGATVLAVVVLLVVFVAMRRRDRKRQDLADAGIVDEPERDAKG